MPLLKIAIALAALTMDPGLRQGWEVWAMEKGQAARSQPAGPREPAQRAQELELRTGASIWSCIAAA